MGQQQSQDIGDRPGLRLGERIRSRRNLKQRMSSFRGNGNDDEYVMEEKIKLYKKELERLKNHGVTKQREHQMELSEMDNELYRKRMDLHRLGEKAKTYYTFWDYVKIVQTATPTVWSPDTMSFIETSESEASESSHANADDPTPGAPKAARSPSLRRSKSPKARRTRSSKTGQAKSPKSPKSGRKKKSLGSSKGSVRKGRRPMSGKEEKKRLMLQKSSTDMTFTIFGFFEAYLLRRLHLALLLKNQSHMQRHRWNDIIVYCYDEIPATKRDTQQAKDWLEYLRGVTPNYQKRLEETLEHLLSLQDKIMDELRSKDEWQEGLEQQKRTIENVIDADYSDAFALGDVVADTDYVGSLPTITQTESGEIHFENQNKPPSSSFSYNINNSETTAATPEAPVPQPAEGHIYAASEFNNETEGATLSQTSAQNKNIRESLHDRVFEKQDCGKQDSSDWSSYDSDDTLGNEEDKDTKKEEKAAKKKDKVADKVPSMRKEERKGRRGSKWKMPWRAQPAAASDSEQAFGDDLKMSAENSALGNEYGRISMRDDDDEDDDQYDYVSQEAKQQPVTSALAGGASMMILQKSISAQQKESKADSQEHFQLSTTGSEDA